MRRARLFPFSLCLLSTALVVLHGTLSWAMDRERVTIVGEEAYVKNETPHPVPAMESGDEVWRDVFQWEKASYIAVHFERFRLAPGERVVVRTPDGRHSFEYVGEGRSGTGGTFWARRVPGDTCEVLYYGSKDARGWGYAIDMFAHGFPQEDGGAELDTETICGTGDDGEFAKCYAASEPVIYDKSRAIARLLINGVALCTGWLVGCEGHLMTNAHCITNPADALNTEYEFMAEGATCQTDCSAQLSCPGVVEDVLGTFVKTGTQAVLDYTLVQLSPELSGRYGFFRLRPGAVPEERIYLNGHPNGKGKTFHVSSDDPVDESGYCEIFTVDEPARTGCSALSPPEAGYMCDSEGGSSGSPVVAYSDHRVVVLHHCGGCPNTGVHIGDVITDLGADLPDCALGQPDGQVRFGLDAYSCSGVVEIQVVDDSIVGAGSQVVSVSSTTEAAGEAVTLVETPPNSGVFSGSIPLSVAPVANGDGVLSISPGDTISVLYIDADDGSGGTNVPRTDTAGVDCLGPTISNIVISNVSGDGATVTWMTDEPATSTVQYGLTTPPGTEASSHTLVTTHRVELHGLSPCSSYFLSVRSEDGAGNGARDDNNGAYYGFATRNNAFLDFPSTDTPVPIPDNNAAGVTSTIVVPDGVIVADVNVEVDITHPFAGDLELYLITPAGEQILLADMRGDDGDNYTDTIFDDEAATSIVSGTAPFTGAFRPERPLSAADGLGAAGTWRLKVVDLGPTDFGTLDGWTLHLTYAGACGASLVHESTVPIESCAGTGTGGNGIVEPGEDLVLPIRLRNNGTTAMTGIVATLTTSTTGVAVTRGVASYPDIAVGATASSDAPHFAATVGSGVACGSEIVLRISGTANEGSFGDNLRLALGAPGTETATYASSNVPRPLPDLITITSIVDVVDTRAVRDAEVELTITHTYDEDLDIFLIGPSGARVELSTDNGAGGDNYTGTRFDDEAERSITEGVPPFSGRFRPEGSLSALDGFAANGSWTLELLDDTLQDVGILESWSLTLTTGPDVICDACAVAAPAGAVTNVRFLSKSRMDWDAGAGASFYHVYRGVPQNLGHLASSALDSCRRLTTGSTSTGDALSEVPSSSFFWYLVRAATSGGQGPAGDGATGPRIQDSSGDCP